MEMNSNHCCRCPIIEFSRFWEALAVSVDLVPTCNIIEINVHSQYQLCIKILDSFHVAFLVNIEDVYPVKYGGRD